MNPVISYRYVLPAFLQMANVVFNRSSRANDSLLAELDKLLHPYGLQLSPTQVKRIKLYTIQSAIMNKWFSTLRGKPITEVERLCSLYLGALTPLSDDLTDHENLTSRDILAASDPNCDDTSSAAIVAGRFLYNKLLMHANETFSYYSRIALEAQDKSMVQRKDHQLEPSMIEELTFLKGSSSTQLGRSMLANPLAENEEKAVDKLGYLLQITNDAFDVFKDREEKQQTLLTTAKDVNGLHTTFNKLWQEMNEAFLRTSYSRVSVLKFLSQVATILSRGEVAFRRLVALQQESGGIFQLNSYERRQLICDMEKPINMAASVQISAGMIRRL